MKTYPLCLVAAALIIILSHTAFSQQSAQGMKIVSVTEYYFSADKGIADGVQSGEIYVILRNNMYIGKAKVVEVLQNVSVLSPSHIAAEQQIQTGDLLVHSQSEEALMIVQSVDEETTKLITEENYVEDEYYIKLGQEKAVEEFRGINYSVLGFAGGASTAIIGWGVGALIIHNTDVEVPREFFYGIEEDKRELFSNAYKSTTKHKRLNSFGKGALLGTGLLAVILIGMR